jgi:hypothetical protein
VHLGCEVVQGIDELVALQRAPGRRQAGVGLAIGEILQDRGALVEHRSVVQPQRRDIAVGGDLEEVPAVVGLLVLDEPDLDGQIGLQRGNMRRQRAGHR